jgi:hypothetical protein
LGVISALLIMNESSESSMLLASGSIDKTIKLWYLIAYQCLATLECSFGQVLC